MRSPTKSWLDGRMVRYFRLVLGLIVMVIVVPVALRYQWPSGANAGQMLVTKIGGTIGYLGLLAGLIFGPCWIIYRDFFFTRKNK